MQDLLPLMLFSAASSFTPGPNNLMIMNSGQTLKPITFLQTLSFQWINPKAWLMLISTISIFTVSTNYIYNAVFISILYLLMCIPCTGAWLLFGNVLNHILKKDSHRVWFNIAMALAIVASIGMIIID